MGKRPAPGMYRLIWCRKLERKAVYRSKGKGRGNRIKYMPKWVCFSRLVPTSMFSES